MENRSSLREYLPAAGGWIFHEIGISRFYEK
jgi:hypothetical protein